MIAAVKEMAPVVGTRRACAALSLPPSVYYRSLSPRGPREEKPRPLSARALPAEKRAEVLTVLNSERFADVAPPEVYATLLDENVRHCSVRSMYRYLAAENQVRERRNPGSLRPKRNFNSSTTSGSPANSPSSTLKPRKSPSLTRAECCPHSRPDETRHSPATASNDLTKSSVHQ